MIYPIYYSTKDHMYYIKIFHTNGFTYYLEKSIEAYEDKNSLWHAAKTKIKEKVFDKMLLETMVYIDNIELEENYIANYMLLME